MLRKAIEKDIPMIMAMIDAAREVLKHHQSGQWQGIEPSQATIENDVTSGNYWVLEEQHRVVAGCALLPYDEDYLHLIEGQWLNEDSYLVIHRLVVQPELHRQGFGQKLLWSIEEVVRHHSIHNIRVDTHRLNGPMIRLLTKLGYHRCGVVVLKGELIREAFQKTLRTL